MKRLLMLVVLLGLISVIGQAQTLIRVPQDQPTVQAGINAASNGDTVLVAHGTYTENIKINKKIILGSLFIQGGDTSHISQTIIDGSGAVNPDSGSTITIGAATDTTLVISGFTITGGKGNKAFYPSWGYQLSGGGIESSVGGSARITKNIITQNHVGAIGTPDSVSTGGICLVAFPPRSQVKYSIIDYNVISGNTAIGTLCEGGGLTVAGYMARIQGNIIENNIANGSFVGVGGGMFVGSYYGDTIYVVGNLIRGNTSSHGGGGMNAFGAIAPDIPAHNIIQNNIIVGNISGLGAGIRTYYGAVLDLTNNTIANNTSSSTGAGIYANTNATVRAMNNIFSNAFASTQIYVSGALAYFTNNLINGQVFGTNSLNADPKFVKFTDQYYIHDGPARDFGVSSTNLGGVTVMAPTTDYRLRSRVGNPDLGAHEFDPAVSVRRSEVVPTEFSLSQNFPNPFNPSTEITYSLPFTLHASLKVYDILGREVATLVGGEQPAGAYKAEWNASMSSGVSAKGGYASSVYFYRLEAVGKDGRAFVETKKMMLVR